MRSFVFANEDARYGQYGWVYLAVNGICTESEIGIEVIDLDTYNRYRNNPAMLKKCRVIVPKIDLAPMTAEMFNKYESYMYDKVDMSYEIVDITTKIINAYKEYLIVAK